MLAGVAVVDWMASFHHPPLPLQVFGAEFLEERDVSWGPALAGDRRETHALVVTNTLHELLVDVSLVAECADVGAILDMDLFRRGVLFPSTSMHFLAHSAPVRQSVFAKHSVACKRQCSARHSMFIEGVGAFRSREMGEDSTMHSEETTRREIEIQYFILGFDSKVENISLPLKNHLTSFYQ